MWEQWRKHNDPGYAITHGGSEHHHRRNHPGKAAAGGVEGRANTTTARNTGVANSKLDQVIGLLAVIATHAAKSDPELASRTYSQPAPDNTYETKSHTEIDK